MGYVENIRKQENEKLNHKIHKFGSSKRHSFVGDPIEETLDKALNEDAALQRISLAYEDLQTFPKIILDKIADCTKILDISHNKIK